MELLSPAGNLEKLKTVYRFGADAAYIGINHFSLRHKADNFSEKDIAELLQVKGDKKLFGAFNIYFKNNNLRMLETEIDLIKQFPLDAFIISDIGAIPFFQKHFPNAELHLSTQANCINTEAAKLYYQMGFKRVILGREASLEDIKEMKQAIPELEIETFIHGAMCLAYSGRCFLSRYMTGRSANQGDCAHTCRWKYDLKAPVSMQDACNSGQLVLEEELRPNEYFPIYENEAGTTILSSRDLCLIDHLQPLVDAGIDSFKIEGRMKSLYYAAVITRAYRKALDAIKGIDVPNLSEYREEIFKVSHREFTTGFFFDDQSVHQTTDISYLRQHIFVGDVIQVRPQENNEYLVQISLKNQLNQNDTIEMISPDILYKELSHWRLLDGNFNPIPKSDHGKETWIQTTEKMEPGFLIRRPIKQNEKPEVQTAAPQPKSGIQSAPHEIAGWK